MLRSAFAHRARIGIVLSLVCIASAAPVPGGSQASKQPTTAPDTRFVIPTVAKIGFLDGEVFYPVRMKADAFRQRFGEPDQKLMTADGKTVSYYNYFSLGLQVAIRRGECWGYSFYLVPPFHRPSGPQWKPADIATDSGIRAGMSFEEATRITPPTEKHDSGGSRSAIYPWGAITWQKGQLTGFTITNIYLNRRDHTGAMVQVMPNP